MDATTTTAPPRLPPARDSLAALNDQIAARKVAIDALSKFTIDGVGVFEGSPDGVDNLLRNIFGLTELLENTFVDADTNRDGMVSGGRDIFVSRAFGAIRDLTALAIFLNEDR